MDHGPSHTTDLLRAVSVPSRMQILTLLKARGPLPVKRIAKLLGMTSPAVSQHLKVLRNVGLVHSERHGYVVPYEVNADGLADCCGRLIRVFACETCGSVPEEGAAVTETEALLQRREALLGELRQVEIKLEQLRP